MIKVDMFDYECLPYFGKDNSISSIKKINNDEEKYYLVKRYDANGNIRQENFRIPMKSRSFIGLLENYCDDISDYLSKKESEYIENKKKKRIFNTKITLKKLKLYEKMSNMGICLGTVLVGLAISVIPISLILYTGMIILVIAGVGMVVLNDIDKEQKLDQFINNYDDLAKKLNDYKSNLSNRKTKELTKYNGLVSEKTRGNILKLKKVKTLDSKAI